MGGVNRVYVLGPSVSLRRTSSTISVAEAGTGAADDKDAHKSCEPFMVVAALMKDTQTQMSRSSQIT